MISFAKTILVRNSLVLNMDPNLGYLGSIATLRDLSGNNNTVASSSGVFFVDGSPKYISYAGNTTDNILLAANSILRPGTGNFTYQLWVLQNIQTGSGGAFIDQRNLVAASNGLAIFPTGNPFRLGYFSNSATISGSITLLANRWYNLAVTRNGTTITLYVNGVADGTGTSATNITDTNYYIGYNISARSITGRMGQVLQYNRALSAAEILQNFNATRHIYGA